MRLSSDYYSKVVDSKFLRLSWQVSKMEDVFIALSQAATNDDLIASNAVIEVVASVVR